MKVIVKVYDNVKYDTTSKVVAEQTYEITSFSVTEISDKEIFALGFEDTDPYKEYLVLTFKNGETSTFRNSFVDMFRA